MSISTTEAANGAFNTTTVNTDLPSEQRLKDKKADLVLRWLVRRPVENEAPGLEPITKLRMYLFQRPESSLLPRHYRNIPNQIKDLLKFTTSGMINWNLTRCHDIVRLVFGLIEVLILGTVTNGSRGADLAARFIRSRRLLMERAFGQTFYWCILIAESERRTQYREGRIFSKLQKERISRFGQEPQEDEQAQGLQ